NVATVRNTWIGRVISDPPVEHPNIRFVLDFDADAFPPLKGGMQLSGQVENSDGAKFVADTIARVPEKNLIRYVIEITEPTKATDLRARLKIGNSEVSETWTYTWQP
ncbi:MAG: Periplasmic glucan biosynthesis protein MdoG, partial [Verrucomicrobiales bacterium]|nr:Periplasmic glucan biosynthesis protein MdoG [Verrucomicrobiales bacterium]